MKTIAAWASRGGKWSADLQRDASGDYTLTEYKRGQSVGRSFRPAATFDGDDARAIAYYAAFVATAFDVEMIRFH